MTLGKVGQVLRYEMQVPSSDRGLGLHKGSTPCEPLFLLLRMHFVHDGEFALNSAFWAWDCGYLEPLEYPTPASANVQFGG